MRLAFWLLDINDEVVDGKLEIHLWGLDDEGHRVLVIDRDFQPYFYLTLEDGADQDGVIREIEKKASTPPIKVKAIEDLLNYKLKMEKSCLPVATIEDRGLTQVPPGEITCLAIGPAPSNKLDEMTGDLPLL